MYTKHIQDLEDQLKKVREESQQMIVSQREQNERQIADLRADSEKQLEALRAAAAAAKEAAAEAEARRKASEEEMQRKLREAEEKPKTPEVDVAQVRAEERQKTLLAVVRAVNEVLSREAYSSVLPVKPADESNIDERTCAGKAQELAEVAKSMYERAASAAAGSYATRKSSTFEMSLLREENEKLKKDIQEVQRRYDALTRQKMADNQLDLEVKRLQLENKQLRMDLANKRDEERNKSPMAGTIQVASSSDSSEDDADGEYNIKRNLLKQEAASDKNSGSSNKKWIILVAVIVGLVALGIGAAAGFLIAKEVNNSS